MKKLLSFIIIFAITIALLPSAATLSASAAENNLGILNIEGTEDLFSEYDYSDSQIISDEEFFGLWNDENSTWIKEPYFNYEKYSKELGEVEEAAKAGDYELAGVLITEYYKNKFLNQPRIITKSGSRSEMINAQLLCYNMYGGSNFTNTDIVTLSTTEQLISGDVTTIAQSAAKDTAKKEYTFQICAAYDDGSIGYIYSRESDKAPYVKANVNGNNMIFPVIADTYIRGGADYQNINYGTTDTNPENKLYISEHVDYSNANITYPLTRYDYYHVDLSGCMRARLTVDFTGLNTGDVINSAQLCFTGASDSENGKQCVIQYKADIFGKETDSSWSWKNSYRYMMSYIGLPGIAGFSGDNSSTQRYERGNWSNVTALSGVYRYTMDETYAYHAFRYWMCQYLAWGHQANAGSYNQGNLALGTRAQAIPIQFTQLATSKYFTSEYVVPMLKYAWICGEGLVNCWNNQSETMNWGTYQTEGLSNLAINFKEFKVVDEPLKDGGFGSGKLGGWEALVNHRLYLISGKVINEDGSFRETMGYGKSSINNFLSLNLNADEAGETREVSIALAENLKKILYYITSVAGPDVCDFQYGDSYTYASTYDAPAKQIADITGDPFLLWIGTRGKEGTPPDFTSVVYPYQRQVAMKSGWSNNDMYILFAADNTIITHNHCDDLLINMFCYGSPLLTDPRQYSYGTNDPIRLAVYAPNMHNTLSIKVVNPNTGRKENVAHKHSISGIWYGPYPVYSQFLPKEDWDNIYYFNTSGENKPGTIHRTELNRGYDYAEMSHSNYENLAHKSSEYSFVKSNVNMKRSLLFLKNAKYMIVTDYVTALDDEDYIVDQNWHFLPNSNLTIDENGIAESHYGSGANVQIIPVFAKSQMDAYIEQEGYYSPRDGVIEHNPYPVYEKSGSGNKVFNTVILPTVAGQNIKSSATNLKMNVPETIATASHIVMTDTDLDQSREVYYYFLHDTRQKEQRKFDMYSTDAKMALVEYYANKPTMLILQDGTNITETSTMKYLVKSGENIEELSVTFDSGNMYLDSSKEIDLDALTIRAEESVVQVFLNNEPIQFRQADNYIYFGDEPILADPEEEDSENDTAIKVPSHGSNSGGGNSGGNSSKKEDPKPVDPTPVDPKPETPASDAFKAELQGHWGEEEISALIDAGIVKGSDGKLNLKNTVTRAELLALIVRAMGLEEKAYNGEFADVSADDWYASVIATAKAAGFVDGDGEMVMPSAPVTREQMAKFLVSAYKTKNSDSVEEIALSFTDSDSISAWAIDFVNQATAFGLLNGMEDGRFAPKNAVLREQAFVAIYRLMNE